ncbi:E3 ubiquitin-protein ligase Rnf220 [Manduca sexta]|uniref:E3 ubiquitin-protein ligase Rnf220 n=1 Tax=Manduca sexta TaxID=7130 RepID=UPI00118267EB|nr:E3 ubiquitin-protein ligase Rnf220 [Manduca sexta]
MLPILLYHNMDSSANGATNSNFGQNYDDNIILNCVRNRKKVTELPNCPVCSCTIRQGELENHLSLELDRLTKLSSGGTKRKLSVTSPGNLAVPGSSSTADVDEQEVDVSGCLGSDVYQRVHTNRLRRLRARRRSTPPPASGECPVCNTTVPVSRLQRHALRCLKRTGAELDEDVPDTSSEDESIDVENDEPQAGSFGAEYQWCGEWRVRATALQDADARSATCVRRASNDQALVVDGDEDTELYGPPQYSPSRIAPDSEITPSDNTEAAQDASDVELEEKPNAVAEVPRPNGLVVASAETRIQALKAMIKELERKQNGAAEAKCLICLGQYTSPAVSIQCWHVYCEVCWLQSLKSKKICPQCNAITTAQHLRRIYM